MTRTEVSKIQNRWYDGQRVDQTDLIVEQDRNVNTDASIIQNHFGSGVLPESFIQKIIFDTHSLFPDQVALVASCDLDGTGLRPLIEYSTDTVLGNQLEVELTDSDDDGYMNGISTVGGRFSSKVAIIGLDFQGNLQYDRFYFYRKEKQVTKKHYTKILCVFLNDVYGNNKCSRKLGGRIIIRESKSFQLSRDCIMISQDVEPNLFFRDLRISNVIEGIVGGTVATLSQAIQAGIGSEYSFDALDINTTVKREIELTTNDVTTRLAQKFLATSNNIQKITLLLGIRRDDSVSIDHVFDWSGDLIVNIYELQSSVSCPTELVPQLAIEFEPNPEPITQLSISKDTLEQYGYILTDILQPVDFVFNGSFIGSTSNVKIIPGKYYAISINRSGDSTTGILFTGIGNSYSINDRFSIFSGNWTDVSEEDMWYQVWTDTAKVSDGKAYDAGHGIDILKTTINELGVVVDYSFDNNVFIDNGQNTLNTAIIEAILEQSDQEQDERTGNPVYSRQKFEPSFSFVTNTTLTTLRESSDPLVIGCARDINAKNNIEITGVQYYPGLARGNHYIIVNPDPNIESQQWIGSKLIPDDTGCASLDYKIVRIKSCVDGYGDVLGDGIIDEYDIARAIELLGQSLSLITTQELIRDGYISTLELLRADVDGDGYITYSDITIIEDYVNRRRETLVVGASSFTHIEIEVQNSTGRFDGYYTCNNLIAFDGYNNIADPSTLTDIELKYYGYNNLPDITLDNTTAFERVPWNAVTFKIKPMPFWQDYLVQFSSDARQVPAIFTYPTNSTSYINSETGSCASLAEISICQETTSIGGSCVSGRNDFYIPDNLIIGKGQILNTSGYLFKQDLEIQTITLELPPQVFYDGYNLNIFEKLVYDNDSGFTKSGYRAAKFADCSTVQSDALLMNQIRFGVAIQSIYPSLDGYDIDGYGIIIDNTIGVNIDQSTGILTLNVKDISCNSLIPELRTKIIITLYLKKAGWNNEPLTIGYNEVEGLFKTTI